MSAIGDGVGVTSEADLDLIERADETLDVLHGKWKVHLLVFMARGVHRHGRYSRDVADARSKALPARAHA